MENQISKLIGYIVFGLMIFGLINIIANIIDFMTWVIQSNF